jgi:protein-tyrosine phosphatase
VIDLHSHLLPGVDDGSRSLGQSVRTLRMFAEEGITAVCLTPHMTVSRAAGGIPQEWDSLVGELAAAAPRKIALHRGVEMMLDRPLTEDAATRRFTLNGSRYMLVEFTRLIADTAVLNALTQVSRLGLVPVLAHPERYSCCTPEVVRRWKGATGALMQVDATTIILPRARGERARQLLAHGLADILAADNHGDARSLSTAREALAERGQAQFELLATLNPAAILEDGPTEEVPPVRLKESLLNRIKTLLHPED